MTRYDNIEQGSIEWHEIRWRKIGGSSADSLFLQNKTDTLFIDLLSQHIEDFDFIESYENQSMLRGKELEPEAINYISNYIGISFGKTGWIQSDIDILGISPDGITDNNEIACESKCLSRKEHTNLLLNGLKDKDKLCQIIHYFTVIPMLKELYFIAYRPESVKPYIKCFTLDIIVDLGWKTKVEVKQIGKKGVEIKPKNETVSDVKTISEWVEIEKQNAIELQKRIQKEVNNLKF